MLEILMPELDDAPEILARFEHSLYSMAKWEAKFHLPFYETVSEMTLPQTQEYVRMMCVNEDQIPNFTRRFTLELQNQVVLYIQDPQTATKINELPDTKQVKSIITTELIYYWMLQFQIPFECDKWNIQRLMMLIRICGIKNGKPKKMSAKQQREHYQRLNEERRRMLGSSG